MTWTIPNILTILRDPIADKARVGIARMVIVGYSSSSWTPWLGLPATVILFREVFVSGLREYLGDTAGTLKSTYIAKWKTTTQMVAIAFLFAQGTFEHYLIASTDGMDQAMVDAILTGAVEDLQGLQWKLDGMIWSGRIGLWMLWIAAALTLISGYDYLRKSVPYLKD